MQRSKNQEVEIKLPFESASVARQRLEQIGARLVRPRTFEDNVLLDRAHDPLATAGKLLRLRRFGDQAWLTLKAPVAGTHRHKVREEHETRVADPAALDHILSHLDFTPAYRYQKFRTLYQLAELHVCLDETPLGCYVELEGHADDIDRVAERLGFGPEQYVLGSYRELHEVSARRRGEEPGDLMLDPAETDARR